MKNFLLICLLMIGIFGCNSNHESSVENSFSKKLDFALANPLIESQSIFFKEKNKIKIRLGLDQVKIHYTLDGSEPTENSPIFFKEIILGNSATLKAKAFHPDYLPSDIVQKHFLKLGEEFPIKEISLNKPPIEKYEGKGPNGLIDRKKGSTNFRSKEWLGFSGGNFDAIIEFEKSVAIQKVIVSTLLDHDSWIFLPKEVEVYFSNDGKNYSLLKTKNFPSPPSEEKGGLHFIDLGFEKTEMKFLKIEIEPLPSIPDWHAGKGTPPWLFLDEIVFE